MATKVTGLQTLSAEQRAALEKEPFKFSTSPFKEGAVFTISGFTPEINTWEDSKTGVLKDSKIFIIHLKEVDNKVSTSFITGGRRGWIQEQDSWKYQQRIPRMGTLNVDIRNYLETHNGLTMGEVAEALNKIFKGCTFRCNYINIIKDPRDLYNVDNLGSMLEFNWVKGPDEIKQTPKKKNPTKQGSSSLNRQQGSDPTLLLV